MDFAEGRRQIAIDAHLEGDARDAGYRASHAAGIARRDQNRREHAEKPDAQRDRAHGNGVKDAALGIDAGGRRQCQNGEGAADVHERDERAGAEDRARQRPARIVHLFGHAGNELEAGERKCDLRPEVDRVPVPRRHHVREA